LFADEVFNYSRLFSFCERSATLRVVRGDPTIIEKEHDTQLHVKQTLEIK
jgi:hypothetical protein